MKRAFDLAYYIYYASFVNIFNLNGEGYDPEVLPDVDLGSGLHRRTSVTFHTPVDHRPLSDSVQRRP